MILSTLVTNRTHLKTAFTYLLISIFVALFGGIYEVFSHGVYSNFMLYAFAFPLVGGCLPFFALGMWSYVGGEKHPIHFSAPRKLTRNLYHSGIATLTIGSVIRGVLDIYGTTNFLTNFYWPVGIGFVVVGIISYFYLKSKRTATTPSSGECSEVSR